MDRVADDLRALRSEMNVGSGELRGEMNAKCAQMRTGMDARFSAIHARPGGLTGLMVTVLLAMVGGVGGLWRGGASECGHW